MDSKLNIVIIGPAYPLRGGLASYNQLLAKKFQEAGHQVKIVTFSLQYPQVFFPGKTQYSSDPPPEGLDIEVSLNSVNPLNWIKLGRKLKKQAPDLVIFRYWIPFMGPCLGVIGRMIKSNGKTRVVAITDNIVPHERRWFDAPVTNFFLKSCHGFVCMSRAVMKDLESHALDKPTKFNPHPMYENFGPKLDKGEAREKLGLDEDGNYLLFFGFIRKYKGLDLLLEAMADERLAELNVQLIVAGEYYEDPKPYLDIIRHHQIGTRILEHTQFIADSQVREYFCAADMVVQTYKDATQSGVTQIAYYYDRPMLVTNVGGLAELVPDGKVGYVCPVEVSSISDALYDFYSNQREGEMSAAVSVEKEAFSWDSMIASLKEVAGL